jgi:hypothetical protein
MLLIVYGNTFCSYKTMPRFPYLQVIEEILKFGNPIPYPL